MSELDDNMKKARAIVSSWPKWKQDYQLSKYPKKDTNMSTSTNDPQLNTTQSCYLDYPYYNPIDWGIVPDHNPIIKKDGFKPLIDQLVDYSLSPTNTRKIVIDIEDISNGKIISIDGGEKIYYKEITLDLLAEIKDKINKA